MLIESEELLAMSGHAFFFFFPILPLVFFFPSLLFYHFPQLQSYFLWLDFNDGGNMGPIANGLFWVGLV